MSYDVLQYAEDYTVRTDEVEIVLGEPMRYHTNFRIGGSAELFVSPYSEDALAIGLEMCRKREIPYTVIGRGSNLLVSDRGIRGVVFDLSTLTGYRFDGNTVFALAGTTLAALAGKAAERGLSGLEFAAGIPGSLGGAVFMNAGAYGGEMKDIVESARVMDEAGRIRTLSAEELELSYRHSKLEETGEILLSAVLRLKSGDRAEIERTMQELAEKRRDKQPLNYPSAGSTFKRPAGHFAGKLIEEAGLKGFSVGGAQVSEKHAGFVINKGGATAADVMALCREVQARVKENSGVDLELEVRLVGEW
ncbi:MAG: UDP-N-acetylmuramate dehydrogenase [Oscillospiraceae bacterium]|nr:UDP-N-acetylmuramate dehydrogenase [Lachnospiraceae bacterium]MBQ6428883.1 UDP-N-acetylmuramate dehydrogenase [Oscillospiraceae bacterium]